jgi:hypothetical protein
MFALPHWRSCPIIRAPTGPDAWTATLCGEISAQTLKLGCNSLLLLFKRFEYSKITLAAMQLPGCSVQ